MIETIRTVAPDRDAWLAARRAEPYSVGASDVPAILGVSPYRTPWDVWASHHAPEHVNEPGNPADLARGHHLEAAVLRMWSAATGRDVEHHDYTVIRLLDSPWATFSPDGLSGPEHVEAKTIRDGRGLPPSGVLSWDDAPANAALWSHVVQAAWTSVVLGTDRTHLVVMGPFFDVYTYEIPTPSELRDKLMRAVSTWRETHLVGGVEPDRGRPVEIPRGTESTDDELPAADDAEAEAIAGWLSAKASADKAREHVRWLDGLANEARDKVAALARIDRGPGLRVGASAVSWKVTTRRTVTVGAVEKHAPDLADTLIKTSTTRALRVSGTEDAE